MRGNLPTTENGMTKIFSGVDKTNLSGSLKQQNRRRVGFQPTKKLPSLRALPQGKAWQSPNYGERTLTILSGCLKKK